MQAEKQLYLWQYSTMYLKATSIQVSDAFGTLNIAAVYCPPKHKIQNSQFTSFFKTLGPRFISGGDYNSKHPLWGSRLTSPKGKSLYESIINERLSTYSSGQPTYWPSDINKIPDVLDFFIVKGVNQSYIRTYWSQDLSSDHSPVLLIISSFIIEDNKQSSIHNNKTDWKYFSEWLINNSTANLPLKSALDVNEAIEYVTRQLHQAAWYSTPEIKQYKTTNIPQLIREKVIAKRKLKNNGKSLKIQQILLHKT